MYGSQLASTKDIGEVGSFQAQRDARSIAVIQLMLAPGRFNCSTGGFSA